MIIFSFISLVTSAIVSFDRFEFYEAKTIGMSEGGIYKENPSFVESSTSTANLFYIKWMDSWPTIAEYVGSNIANFLLEGRAPKADLVINNDRVGIASHELKGFLPNGELTVIDVKTKYGFDPDMFASGYIIGQDGKVCPKESAAQEEAKNNPNFKIVPPLVGGEDVLVVAEFLAHGDMHNYNWGPIFNGNFVTTGLLDFSQSLVYSPDFRVSFNYNLPLSHLSIERQISATERLLNKESAIYNLLDALCSDVIKVNLPSCESYNIKENFQRKIAAFKVELSNLQEAQTRGEQHLASDTLVKLPMPNSPDL